MTTGIIAHLNMFGMTANKSWFPTPRARFAGMMFIGGGLVSGFAAGRFFFGSPELQRLSYFHREEKA